MHPQPLERTPRATATVPRTLKDNLREIRARIAAAQQFGAHATRGAVGLVVVTKSAPPGGMDALYCSIDPGSTLDVGENRVADASAKRSRAPRSVRWHGIGHLQTNKVRKALDAFDVFHALDSSHLAVRLESVLAETDRRWPVYAEVNAARDPAKFGIAPEEALAFLKSLSDHPHLEVVGLMTMARDDADATTTRETFATLRALRDEAVTRGIGRVPAEGLSMGMTGDFEIAVEEGATCVRVGRAIWDDVDVTASNESAAQPRARRI